MQQNKLAFSGTHAINIRGPLRSGSSLSPSQSAHGMKVHLLLIFTILLFPFKPSETSHVITTPGGNRSDTIEKCLCEDCLKSNMTFILNSSYTISWTGFCWVQNITSVSLKSSLVSDSVFIICKPKWSGFFLIYQT